MSSQAPRNGERGYHQDFIARIRYSNALPPPPNPPKLLDIPNTGLASGQYTTPGFASRLSREQPLNIEADAELGMPLDLVGMPGIFDGDESSIQAPSQPPQVHAHDRALLRPLATLGKPQVSGTSVSFLRRTEYISNANTTNKVSPFHRTPKKADAQRPPKRKSPEPEAGTPAAIKRKIEKGFESAQQSLKDKSRIRHPTKLAGGINKGLKVVEAYSVLPDLNAFPDSGTYVTYKFAHAPVPNSKEGYDRRLHNSILKFVGRNEEEEAVFQQKLQAHETDPDNNPKPLNQVAYEMYLAQNLTTSEKFRASFDLLNPNRDDSSLQVTPEAVSADGKPTYSYNRYRSYLATIESEGAHDTKYTEELAFAVDAQNRTAWYYPIMQRSRMEPPRRIYNANREQEQKPIDNFDLLTQDPDEVFQARMDKFKEFPRNNPDKEDEDDKHEDVASQDGGASPRRERSESPAANGRGYSQERRVESEQDAEGDEDD